MEQPKCKDIKLQPKFIRWLKGYKTRKQLKQEIADLNKTTFVLTDEVNYYKKQLRDINNVFGNFSLVQEKKPIFYKDITAELFVSRLESSFSLLNDKERVAHQFAHKIGQEISENIFLMLKEGKLDDCIQHSEDLGRDGINYRIKFDYVIMERVNNGGYNI